MTSANSRSTIYIRPEDYAEDAANFCKLVEAVGGPDRAREISGLRPKRLAAAMEGDTSAFNFGHLVKLEQAAGSPMYSKPSYDRFVRRHRESMPVPTLKELQIAASEWTVAAAKYSHELLRLPDNPSVNQLRASEMAEGEAASARWRYENMHAVYIERAASNRIGDGE